MTDIPLQQLMVIYDKVLADRVFPPEKYQNQDFNVTSHKSELFGLTMEFSFYSYKKNTNCWMKLHERLFASPPYEDRARYFYMMHIRCRDVDNVERWVLSFMVVNIPPSDIELSEHKEPIKITRIKASKRSSFFSGGMFIYDAEILRDFGSFEQDKTNIAIIARMCE